MAQYQKTQQIDGWNVGVSILLPDPPAPELIEKWKPANLFLEVPATHNFVPGTYVDENTQQVIDWQQEDIDYLAERDVSANWSEMGAFKTTTVEWLIQRKLAHIENPKVLIITTKSGKGTYYQTLPYVLPDYNVLSVTTKEVRRVLLERELKLPADLHAKSEPTIVLTHYNVFSTRKPRSKPGDSAVVRRVLKQAKAQPNVRAKELLEIDWDMIVLDEAHRIKNPNTSWSSQIKKLKAPFKHIMTGTGFINRPDEIWSLWNFLEPHRWSNYWGFRAQYVDEFILDNGYREVLGVKPWMVKKFRAIRAEYGPRRLKTEVFKDLEEPIYSDYKVELNPTQQKMYNEIRDYLYTLDQQGEPIQSPNVLSQLNRLRQICVATPEKYADYYDEELERRIQKIRLIEPSAKLDTAMEIIEGLEWDDELRSQIVVFSCFKDPLSLLEKRLIKSNIPYIWMQEKDNDRVRYEKWAVQFPKKQHQVFMSTLQLGSESISLTPASTVLFLDLSWSPKDNLQARDRVWRPGQKGIAHQIRILATDTVDKRMVATHERKLDWFNTIFGPDEDA